MIVYWLLFLIPAMAAMSPYRLDRQSRGRVLVLVGAILIFIIGLRHEVGHDWNTYIRIFDRTIDSGIEEIFLSPEPGYYVLNVIAMRLGMDVHAVNVFCAVIFVIGLLSFLRRQPDFWLTLAFATPVLIIGVAMAGTRQATAMGFLMLAFNAFQDRKLGRYIGLIVLGVLFHRSVAAFLLFAIFINGRLTLWPLIIAGLAFFGLGVFALREAVSYYTESYVDVDIVAGGALPRIGLSVVSAGLFLYFRRQWNARYDDGVLYTLSALTILMMTLGIFNAHAATDRMLMYLLPIQAAIFARVTRLVSPGTRRQAMFAFVGIYGAVLFVWLNFSYFAQKSWVPYKNILWS